MPTSDKRDTQPLRHVLQRLTDEPLVSVPLLFRFTDMTAAEMSQFTQWWPQQSDTLRGAIAQHLADIAEVNFEVDFSPVFGQLLRDPSPAVRRAALDGLWDTTNVALVPPIINLTVDDPVLEVRVAATKALAHFVMMGVWGQISAAVKDRVIDWLIPLFEDVSVALPVRCAAIEGLGPADRDDIARLIRTAYEHEAPQMQASALFSMGTSADSDWLDIIIEEIDNPFLDVRLEAIRAAGEIGDGGAVSALANRLYEEDARDAQEAVVDALGHIGDDAARRVLRDCRTDPDMAFLRPAIQNALANLAWESMSLDLVDFDAYDDDESADDPYDAISFDDEDDYLDDDDDMLDDDRF